LYDSLINNANGANDMNRNIASILRILSRNSADIVAEGQKQRMAAARALEAEGIVTLTARGDSTYFVRLIRDSQ
jgi:ABC-type polar amino acid transport system ATPase subunit